MRLNEQDTNLFKVLSQSQIGRDFIDYLDRVSDHICDSRTWGPADTKESSNRAAEVVKLLIRNKIVPQKNQVPLDPNQME